VTRGCHEVPKRVINRALDYGLLSVLLAATYFGGVVGLQYAFRALTGQGSTLAVVASTLAIAALFSPLRRRVQTLVERRFYRRKYDATKTLAAFNTRGCARRRTSTPWAATWLAW
jgi:hypothetical protein